MTDLDPRDRDALDRIVRAADEAEPDWADVRRRAARAAAPARRWPRRRRWLLALVPVAVVAGGAATVASLRSSPPEALAATGVACAAEARIDADLTVVDGDGRAPVAICASLWRRGAVAGPVAAAPPLTACDVGTGALYVFPTGEPGFCARHGWSPPPRGHARLAARLAGVRTALVARLEGAGACPSYAAAAAIARRELHRRGLRDWRVDRAGDAAGRPCHRAVALDGTRRAVLIVPEPGVP
jgi:hypothetical protein